MSGDPEWVVILSALLTPTIALVAISIAWSQFRIAKLKWKHELYERRITVYGGANQLIKYIIVHGKTTDDQLANFMEKTAQSDFLFKKPLVEFLDEIFDKAIDLTTLQFELKDLEVGEEKSEKNRLVAEIKKWFILHGRELKDNFYEYLKLD